MDQELANRLQQEVVKLNPSPIIELYELDTTPCGESGDHLYFHNGTGGFSVPISFKGIAYNALPIIVRGFELSSGGEPPRPTLTILNAGGFVSAVVLKMDDMIGAILIRRRTFARFLDGEPEAAPVEYPPDIFKVVHKTREDRLLVEFELGSGIDLDGVRFPARTIVATYCQHIYRGAGCRFAGPYAVTQKYQIPNPGILGFRGYWENTGVYQDGDSVLYLLGDESGLYLCKLDSGTVTGDPNAPFNTTYWTRVQRYRGLWDANIDNYLQNDVVYLETPLMRQVYLALRDIPKGLRPPNVVYWALDDCGKSLNHCRWRFDPKKQNKATLPFGAFPGVLTVPQV